MSEHFSESILIVDDADVVVRLNEILLKKTGLTVVTAHSGKEAIALAQEHHPRVAVMDLNMPDMQGDAVARYFKSTDALRDMVIVIVTAYDNEETRKRCLDAGADYFISKPIKPANLLDLIRSVVRR